VVATDVVVYRPRFARPMAVGVVVLAVLGLGISLVTNFAETWRYLPITALVVYFIWAAYFDPAVIVTPAGVEIKNITRTIELPWPAIERIETKFALTLYTRFGAYSAWAAPAPGRAEIGRSGGAAMRAAASGAPLDMDGRVYRSQAASIPSSAISGGTISAGDLPNSSSGEAAAIVRRRWEELRDAGYLDNPRLETTKPRITWHWLTAAVIIVLAVASALVLVFG